MYAIVEAGGRQYQLEAGRFIDVEMLAAEPGDSFTFDKVLMIVDNKGSHVGEPYVSGAKVKGRVLSHGKRSKIIVYHMRPKKGTRKKQGHRQGQTRVFIDSIELNDKVLVEAKDTGKKAKPADKEAKPAKKSAKTTEKAEAKAPKKAAEKPAAKKAAKPAKKSEE